MRGYYFQHLIYIFLFAGLYTSPCFGQVTKNISKDATSSAKPSPVVIGNPRPLVSNTNPAYDPDLVSQYIRSIFQDSKGNLWFGTLGDGIVRYDEKTLIYYNKNEFFNGNKSVAQDYSISVHAIAEDKNGNIWFGTDQGVIKYDGKIFVNYSEKNGLSNIRVGRKSTHIDKAGNIWIGTEGGAFRYNPSADSTGGECFSLFHLLADINVKDIMEDISGNIWFASQDNGVFRYDGKAIINITEKEGLGENYAGGMIQDKTGNFWFTMKGGICRYDPSASLSAGGKTFTEFTSKDGLGGSEVWGIYLETSGIIWITARGATTRYDPSVSISDSSAFTVFTTADGLNCCVQSMYQDKSGNMWWGAGSGLYRFDGKRFYQVKQKGPW